MPPEYIERRHISMKFDVFSLGVIIIEIMAGQSGRSTSAEMSPQQFIDTVRIVFFFLKLFIIHFLLSALLFTLDLQGTREMEKEDAGNFESYIIT